MPAHAWKPGHRNVDVKSLSKTGDLPNGIGKHGAKKDSSSCVSTEYFTPEYQYG